MKILLLSNYTKGACGVFQRVKQEALEFKKRGHEVLVFSSNAVKGNPSQIAPFCSMIEGIKILRFPYKKLGGESFMYWKFEREALSFNPNIIIAHSFRHTHTIKALKIGKKIGIKVFLVTHAPFVEERALPQKIIVKLYDTFIAPRTLNKFDKVIAITKWEIPYLLKLGLKKKNLKLIQNGIPDEFFEIKPRKGKGVMFLGRISPVKNLEILIKACKELKIKPTIIGPVEEGYNLNAKISPPIYDLKKKIKTIDKHDIFVLPSKRESHPQALIEAMARGKIVIASKTKGANEIIEDGKNGFLFEIGDSMNLRELIHYCIHHKEKIKKMPQEAIKTAEQFKYSKIMKKWEELLR